MMERFAKIVETPTTQVLCYLEYDHVEDQHVMHRMGSSSGMRWDVAIRWDGHDDAKAAQAIHEFDESKALKLVESMAKLCEDSEGEPRP